MSGIYIKNFEVGQYGRDVRIMPDGTVRSVYSDVIITNWTPAATNEHVINLNEHIKVKLTDYGKEVYYHQFDYINDRYGREVCKPFAPRVDEDGYTSFQLWEFIHIYGPYIGVGFKKVIDPLDIIWTGE